MVIYNSGPVSRDLKLWVKTLSLCCVVAIILLLFPVFALCSDLLTDSKEYKDKDFQKGCISDYSGLAKGADINWVWVKQGTQLAGHRLVIGKFENLSDELRSSQIEEIKSIFKEFFDKLKGDRGTLTAELCVYEVQKFSAGKAWIPFAGGHEMQAGMGVELNVRDRGGKLVAKVRHFAREGSRVEDAAQEVAEDLKKYFANN